MKEAATLNFIERGMPISTSEKLFLQKKKNEKKNQDSVKGEALINLQWLLCNRYDQLGY